MSFFKKAFGAGSIFKKQAMPNVQGFFKKGGAGRQFSKMAGEAAGLAGVAGRELRRGANNPVLEQIGNMTVGADKTRQLRAEALAQPHWGGHRACYKVRATSPTAKT